MRKVGFVGWRGMVGSVLLNRMREENDFLNMSPFFYSTSNSKGIGPKIADQQYILKDAYHFSSLLEMDIIVSTQGGDYTNKMYKELRAKGFKGFWIDAASTLRMDEEAVIVLDPINKDLIKSSLASGTKTFVGGNCTVSLMLMALGGLFKNDLIEWVSSMTYQAASGGGARHMRELLKSMEFITSENKDILNNSHSDILELDKKVSQSLNAENNPINEFIVPLAASLIPWIDCAVENGQTKEEWKSMVETNKILGTKDIPIDGTCVRVGAMRSHSQAFTIKLKKEMELEEIERIIEESNPWVKIIPNNKEATIHNLTPAKVSGTLDIPIGRIRHMKMGKDYLTAFTVGDQLLWGAAEPLRRMLNMIISQ